MQDDVRKLHLTNDRIDVAIAEIKTNDPCRLNGPWTVKEKQNVHRVLAAMGCLQEDEIPTAASAIYETGAFRGDLLRIRLIAVGRTTSAELAERYEQVTQLTWRQMLGFIWQRFDTYQNQKTDVQQWDYVGRQLKSMADRAHKPEPFVREALHAVGINDEE